ncbi:MAG: GGDEF domain-containing protein [Lachnospiraceae bacterium]|nr:GGDEF domain-containing protein [Lachnospiraceae bacterium]
MSKRKRIGLLTAVPESIHAHKVFEGVFGQCNKYDYDVAVFAPMHHLSGNYKDYIKGELNIFELINFDLLDGLIVDSISLNENNDATIRNQLLKKLESGCRCPVISLNLSMGEYPVAESSDAPIFEKIVAHVVEEHGVKDICFLTGYEDSTVAKERMETFVAAMERRNLPVRPEWLIYGDFWYTSGAHLAERFLTGELPMPGAVICASDHMALGLINYLLKHGIRVPEDMIVTGFEATQEAALNSISVTSFESNAAKTAADAVDMLRNILEPEEALQPLDVAVKKHIHAGMSCGCAPDFIHSARAFKDSFYYIYRDYLQEDENIDIGQLMEGYVSEIFAESNTPQECLHHIYLNTFYMEPYTKYYLCLKENWLNPDHVMRSGYPEKMKLVVHSTPEPGTGFYEEEKGIVFDTKLMLPQMLEGDDEPSVYYFAPVHFRDKMLGYSVLQRRLTEPKKVNLVYRNWLRHVNTALEMIQTKNKLMLMSVSDEMTGAYNRRGMDIHVNRLLKGAGETDKLLVAVVDMDGLKYINDTYGHAEGDYGIKQVHKAMLMSAEPEEICVRAGGDEFYLFGVGQYTEADIEKHKESFAAYLNKVNETSGKPYSISASIGMEIAPIDEKLNVEEIIHAADVKMYADKVARKKQRT